MKQKSDIQSVKPTVKKDAPVPPQGKIQWENPHGKPVPRFVEVVKE